MLRRIHPGHTGQVTSQQPLGTTLDSGSSSPAWQEFPSTPSLLAWVLPERPGQTAGAEYNGEWRFEGSLLEANRSNVDLRGVDYGRADLIGVDWSDADLRVRT